MGIRGGVTRPGDPDPLVAFEAEHGPATPRGPAPPRPPPRGAPPQRQRGPLRVEHRRLTTNDGDRVLYLFGPHKLDGGASERYADLSDTPGGELAVEAFTLALVLRLVRWTRDRARPFPL